MKHKYHLPDAAWAIAHQQDGVISHKQVSAFGFTRNAIQRVLDDRILWQVTRGLYSVSPDPGWRGLAWGGVILGGDGAALGGRSAGFLHGLCDPSDVIEVLAPRQIKSRGHWRFRRTAPVAMGSPPRTRIHETALDLCAGADDAGVLSILADAVSSKRTTADRLLAVATASRQLPNRGLVVEVLGDVAAGVHSALEERFMRQVLRRHGLPEPERQQSVSDGSYSDNVFAEFRVIIELDGQLGHVGADRWRDFRRDNRHAVAGWVTLRFGWQDVVARPCEVAAQVAEVLRRHGWRGEARVCVGCTA